MKPAIRSLAAGAALAALNIAVVVIFAAAPANAVTMPSGATYIADMPPDAAEAMTLAVTVDGDRVVAYGTNGSDEEAWFFGTQRGGRIDMMSMYADRVQATYDGATLTGTLTMNGDGNPHAFTAAAAPALGLNFRQSPVTQRTGRGQPPAAVPDPVSAMVPSRTAHPDLGLPPGPDPSSPIR